MCGSSPRTARRNSGQRGRSSKNSHTARERPALRRPRERWRTGRAVPPIPSVPNVFIKSISIHPALISSADWTISAAGSSVHFEMVSIGSLLRGALSKDAISRLVRRLRDEFTAWSTRDLAAAGSSNAGFRSSWRAVAEFFRTGHSLGAGLEARVAEVSDLGREEARARYFGDRTDGLLPPT
jgi:hypothetical protein